MLLVVAIIGITSVIAVPYLVRSIQGNRLRTAVRTVVMAGRYARSMALLRQQELILTIDLGQAVISVQPASGGAPAAAQPAAGATNRLAESAAPNPTDDSAPPPDAGASSLPIDIRRELDQITITWVEIDGDARFTEGTAPIRYFPNGRCQPYEIRIEDARGAAQRIVVDALSKARTTGEDEP